MVLLSTTLSKHHFSVIQCLLMATPSVVTLDNCSIHHNFGRESVYDTYIHEIGATVHFLQPYSLHFNPSEKVFSKVKGTLNDAVRD